MTCADLQDVDEEEAAAQRRAERQRREEELDDLDEDEFADFLVDDEEGEKPGEPRRRRRALAKALPTGVSAEAFQAGHPMHMHAYYSNNRLAMCIYACTFARQCGAVCFSMFPMPHITSTPHHGAPGVFAEAFQVDFCFPAHACSLYLCSPEHMSVEHVACAAVLPPATSIISKC